MRYYKVKNTADFSLAYCGKTKEYRELIPNELYTQKELEKLGIDYKNAIWFNPVDVSKKNVYWSFGTRFECSKES